jgi:hypothetical protein
MRSERRSCGAQPFQRALALRGFLTMWPQEMQRRSGLTPVHRDPRPSAPRLRVLPEGLYLLRLLIVDSAHLGSRLAVRA